MIYFRCGLEDYRKVGLFRVKSGVLVTTMKITDLTPQQLRRAASIKERLDGLNNELRRLLDGAMTNRATTSRKKRTMSAAVKRKIAAAQKARWAKRRRA